MPDTPHPTPPARPKLQLVWGRARPGPAAAAAPDAWGPWASQAAPPAPATPQPLTLAQLRQRCAANVTHAYAAGFDAGERRAYMRGWKWGVLCGAVAAACLASLALAAWHTWGPTP
jgi:hypothetical protein